MRIIIAFILTLITATAAYGATKNFLYGEYYIDMNVEEFLERGKARCESSPPDEKSCERSGVKFAYFFWTQVFTFKENRLASVAFLRPLSLPAREQALEWFMEENYLPFMANDDTSVVDFFDLTAPGHLD